MKKIVFCLILGAALLPAAAWAAADRSNAEVLLVAVPKLIEGGDFKTAEDMIKRALTSDDSCPSAHYFLGVCLEKTNRPREAFKEYQAAQSLAEKEKDANTIRKAQEASKRLGSGLIEIAQADQRLLAKLMYVAEQALDADQLETAKSAYAAAVVLAPTNEKAKDGLDKASKAVEARGDPIKAKVAQAALAEVWYQIGIGEKDKAMGKAKDLALKCPDTEAGREAADLVARNFEAPKTEDIKKLKQQLAEQKAKEAKQAQIVASLPPPTPGPGVTPAPAKIAPTATGAGPSSGVDVDALEKTAEADAKKLAKDALATTFRETYQKGKTFYTKATPGTEGNQQAVASALEQFIRCEQLYMRLDDEKLLNESINKMEKDASMLRYACMKMTILSH